MMELKSVSGIIGVVKLTARGKKEWWGRQDQRKWEQRR